MKGGNTPWRMLGVGVDDALVQHSGLFNVADFGFAGYLDGAEICEITFGVHHSLPGHAVGHAVQVQADHCSPAGSHLRQVAAHFHLFQSANGERQSVQHGPNGMAPCKWVSGMASCTQRPLSQLDSG